MQPANGSVTKSIHSALFSFSTLPSHCEITINQMLQKVKQERLVFSDWPEG